MNINECSFANHWDRITADFQKRGAPIIYTNCKGNANIIFALRYDGE